MRKFLILTAAIAIGAALLTTGIASADGHISTVSGSMNGDFGGAHMSWDVDLPADTDAELRLAYWPCLNPDAVQLEVWGADSMLGSAGWSSPCEKTLAWNTGDGGAASIRFSNYLQGVGTNYSVSAEGFSLPGGDAPAAMMAEETMADDSDEAMMADDAGDEVMADDATMADEGEEAMAEEGDGEMMVAEAAADDTVMMADDGSGDSAANGTLVGNAGGAFATHALPVTSGTTYNLEMTRGMDVGGNWPAVGFHVWGSNGLVASSSMSYGSNAKATFTADMDGEYTVQMYNYHHGRTMFYALHNN